MNQEQRASSSDNFILKKLKWMIIIVALIIVAVFSMIRNFTVSKLAYTMAVVLVIFYIIGSFVQRYVNKTLQREDDQAKRDKKETQEDIEPSSNE